MKNKRSSLFAIILLAFSLPMLTGCLATAVVVGGTMAANIAASNALSKKNAARTAEASAPAAKTSTPRKAEAPAQEEPGGLRRVGSAASSAYDTGKEATKKGYDRVKGWFTSDESAE